MRFSKVYSSLAFTIVSLGFGMFFGSEPASAVEGVSAAELQAAIGMIVPNGESFGQLEGYSTFHLDKETGVTGGIVAKYESYLTDDPWLSDELPQIQLLIYAYNSQDFARNELASISDSLNDKMILSQDRNSVLYESSGGPSADSFGTIDAEYKSFHYVYVNGNLLFQASLYRTDGILNENNLQTYTEAIQDFDMVESILHETVNSTLVVLGVLFTPTDADFALNSESYSFQLDTYYPVPSHGTISMDVYIGNPEGAVGTLLDSAGIGAAVAGDLYVYVNEEGRLFAGIYAPLFDADCAQQSGWYRLTSDESLSSYEWNTVELHFGVGGFSLDLNGAEVGSCSVSQSRSSSPLYLGDFPDDSLDESMLGYVSRINVVASTTDTGRTWDSVLTEQLFLDVPNTDPDLTVFEYLKEKNVLVGSDGMLYPEQILNRAEMVKIILKAFGETTLAGVTLPFWDVPANAWYSKYLGTAYNIGMIRGHEDGSFLPGHPINRAEFFTMLERIKGVRTYYEGEFLDVKEKDWFAKGAAYAHAQGLVTNLFFSPKSLLTRRDAARFLYDLLKQ